jgi:uncharacterized YccA/Bax inhibitor family protein
MASGNPALQLDSFRHEAETYHGPAVMTIHGAVIKSGILAALLVIAAGVGFVVCHPETSSAVASPGMKLALMIGGAVGGLLCAIALFFSQRLAPFLGPVYALCEGVFIGGISSYYSQRWHGIIPQAALLTMGILVVMLFAYSTRVIRATPALTKGIIIATGSICLVYLVSWILQMFGIGVPYIHSSGPIGIGFSVLVVGIAAFNFILDFDLIEQGARTGAPKYMEWYAAYGLMVTLVWLYLEVLRLLSKIRGND